MSHNKGEGSYPHRWYFWWARRTYRDDGNDVKFFTALTVVIAIAALAFAFGLLEVPNPVGASESQTSMGQCGLRNRSEFEQPVYAAEDQAKPNDCQDALERGEAKAEVARPTLRPALGPTLGISNYCAPDDPVCIVIAVVGFPVLLWALWRCWPGNR